MGAGCALNEVRAKNDMHHHLFHSMVHHRRNIHGYDLATDGAPWCVTMHPFDNAEQILLRLECGGTRFSAIGRHTWNRAGRLMFPDVDDDVSARKKERGGAS